jgi:hypothetical protein
MKAYEGVNVYIQISLTSALDESEWSASHAQATLPPWKETQVLIE